MAKRPVGPWITWRRSRERFFIREGMPSLLAKRLAAAEAKQRERDAAIVGHDIAMAGVLSVSPDDQLYIEYDAALRHSGV